MGENIITKPLGLVLIITVHMLFNDPSYAEVIGTLGQNITLQFRFNISINENSHIGIYTTGEKKIAENLNGNSYFDIYPENSSVCYHITNLTLNHSNIYWASLFRQVGIPQKSNKVQLIIEEKNTSSTAPPTLTAYTTPVNESSGSTQNTRIVIFLAVLPVVLLATVLPWLICSLVKPKEMGSGDDVKPRLALNKQQQQQQQQQRPAQSSTPIVPETVESSSSMSAPSVIYSVLDFPRRPPTAVEINPKDTEYAAVSYLPEKRYM